MTRRCKTVVFVPWAYCVLVLTVVGVVGSALGWIGMTIMALLFLPRSCFQSFIVVRPKRLWVVSCLGFKCQMAARSAIREIRYRYSPEDTLHAVCLYIILKNGAAIDATFNLSTSENIAAALYLKQWLAENPLHETIPSPRDVAGRGLLLPAGILRPGYRWFPILGYGLFLITLLLACVLGRQSI